MENSSNPSSDDQAWLPKILKINKKKLQKNKNLAGNAKVQSEEHNGGQEKQPKSRHHHQRLAQQHDAVELVVELKIVEKSKISMKKP